MEIKFKEKPKQKESSMDEFISYLFVCRNVLHAMHLSTKSYSQHKSLNSLYDGISEAIDILAEAYQGYYGILLNLKFETGNEYLNYKPVDYVVEIIKYIEHCKPKYSDNSMIVNEIDVLIAKLSKYLYRLKFLS